MATQTNTNLVITKFIAKGLDKATAGFNKISKKVEAYSQHIQDATGKPKEVADKIANDFIKKQQKTNHAAYQKRKEAALAQEKIEKRQEAMKSKLNAAKKIEATKQKEIRRLMDLTGKSANDLVSGLKRMGYRQQKNGKFTNQLGDEFIKNRKNMKALNLVTQRFNMANLSGLFAMMALQRATGGFLTSAVNSYNKANEEGCAFTKVTNQLTAAWEFFKYSLLDALGNSELFQTIVGWVVTLVNKFNELSPATKTFLGIGMFVLFLISTLGLLYFQISLAKPVLMGLKNIFSTTFAGIALIIAGIVIVIQGVFDLMAAIASDDARKIVSAVSKIIIGLALIVAGIALLMGGWMVALVAGIVAVLALIVKICADNWDKILIGFQYMVYGLKVAWIAVKYFFVNITQSIVNFFLSSLKTILQGAAKITEALGLDSITSKINSGITKISNTLNTAKDAIESEKQAELDAVQEVLDAKIKAIKEAEAARDAATTSETTSNALSNISTGGISGLTSLFGANSTGVTSSGALGTTTSNNTTNYNETNITIDGSNSDPTEIANAVMEQLNQQYGTSVGSANG
jgi:hypothetical protein